MLGKVLEVIIGMAFTFFLLSSIASAIQEMIAGVFSWRGSYLSKGIDVILDDAQSGGFKWSLTDFLVAHFTRRAPQTAAERNVPKPDTCTAEQWKTRTDVLKMQSHPLLRGTPSSLPSYVPSRNFALALLETLRNGSQAPLMTQVQSTISALPDGDLKRTLSLFVQNAGGDLDVFRAHLESWFDDAMDRLSGIYKRFSHLVTLILGLAIAVSCNVDSLRLARTLWQEDAVRNATVASATQLAQRIPPQQAPASAPDAAFDFKQSLQHVGDQVKAFEDAHLPFGWPSANVRPLPTTLAGWQDAAGDWRGTLADWAPLVAGWIATALAITLGGPFWFSLIQKLTNIRAAGPEPARSQSGPATAPKQHS